MSMPVFQLLLLLFVWKLFWQPSPPTVSSLNTHFFGFSVTQYCITLLNIQSVLWSFILGERSPKDEFHNITRPMHNNQTVNHLQMITPWSQEAHRMACEGEFWYTSLLSHLKKRLSFTVVFTSPAAVINQFNRVFQEGETVHVNHTSWCLSQELIRHRYRQPCPE